MYFFLCMNNIQWAKYYLYSYGNLQCVLICLLIGYMGYAKDLYDMISHRAIKDTDDDQLYFTNIYLDEKLRVSQCFVISITKVTTSFYCCATVHMSVGIVILVNVWKFEVGIWVNAMNTVIIIITNNDLHNILFIWNFSCYDVSDFSLQFRFPDSWTILNFTCTTRCL